MRTRIISAVFALCVVSALALAASVSAEDRTILAGDSYSIELELDLFDMPTYSWSSDVALDFTVRDPNGDVYTTVLDSTSYNGIIVAGLSGTYTVTWENDALTSAHLTFDMSNEFGEAGDTVESAISFIMWMIILAAIVIVAVVVIIVLVIYMGSKKAPAQPDASQQNAMAAQAAATGHCPTCGTLLDPNTSFCPRCGTKHK